jgi:hypothetical protein
MSTGEPKARASDGENGHNQKNAADSRCRRAHLHPYRLVCTLALALGVGLVLGDAGALNLPVGWLVDDGALLAISAVAAVAGLAEARKLARLGLGADAEKAEVARSAERQRDSAEERLIHAVNELKLQFKEDRLQATAALGVAAMCLLCALGVALASAWRGASAEAVELPVVEALLLGAGAWALTLHGRLIRRVQDNLALLHDLMELQLAVALLRGLPEEGRAAQEQLVVMKLLARRSGGSASPGGR